MKPLLLCIQLLLLHQPVSAILFPRDSGSRESKSLDGLWRFKLSPKDDPDIGFRDSWYSAPLQAIVSHQGGEHGVAGRGRVVDAGAQQLQRHHHRQPGEQMKVQKFSFNIIKSTRSLGAPPGPDFWVVALRAGFGPFGPA